MMEEKKTIRPFFIAAAEDCDGGKRACDVYSENVCSIRPIYSDGRPVNNQTLLLTAHGAKGGRMTVYAPYPVVRQLFADHGYEFIDKDALNEATRTWRKQSRPGIG